MGTKGKSKCQRELVAKVIRQPLPSKAPTKTGTLLTAQKLVGKQKTCLTGKATTNAVARMRIATQDTGRVKKVRKYWPSIINLHVVRRYQKLMDLLCRKLSFQMQVREIAQDVKTNLWFQSSTLAACQEAGDMYVVGLFRTPTCVQFMLSMWQ